jgi:hypothetical protein
LTKFEIALLPCLFLALPAHGETALQVQSWCKEITTYRVGADSKFMMQETFDNGFCWGAFATYQSVTDFANSDGSPLLALCIPAGVSRIQLIKMFVHYVDIHPALGHRDFAEVMDMAIRQSFVCQSTRLKPN